MFTLVANVAASLVGLEPGGHFLVPGVGLYCRETDGFSVCGSVSSSFFHPDEKRRMDRLVFGQEKGMHLNNRQGSTSDLISRNKLASGNAKEGSMENNRPNVAVISTGWSLQEGLIRAVLFLLPARANRWGL